MARNRKGNGSVYRNEGKGRSKNYTMSYRHPITGERVQHTTGKSTEAEALVVLGDALAAARKGESIAIQKRGADAWTFERAVKALTDTATDAALASLEHQQRRLRLHLQPVFKGKALAEITTDMVREYRAARRTAGASIATINGECAYLRRAFILAREAGYRGPRPTITLPDPSNARQGFFEYEDFVAVHDALPAWWQGMFTTAYVTGWRMTSEIAPLRWSRNVNLRAGTLTIFDSKNGEGRVFPFAKFPALKAAILEADRVRRELAKAGTVCDYVFHHDGRPLVSTPGALRTSRTGTLLPWVRRAWHQACADAGVAGLIPHDLRRTAVRNLINAGVPEATCMKLTGHKTREIFARYFIVDEQLLGDAVARYADAAASTAAAAAAAQAGQQPAA